MKSILIILFLFFMSIKSQAVVIDSQIEVSRGDESLSKFLRLQCGADEEFCDQLCGQNECFVPETICVDCVTHSYNVLQIIFTDLNAIYQSQPNRVQDSLVQSFLRNQSFMTIKSNSFLNLYTPEHAERNRDEFQKFCEPESQDPQLVLAVDRQQKLQNLIAVICANDKGSYFKPVDYNPLFSNKPMRYWDSRQAIIIPKMH